MVTAIPSQTTHNVILFYMGMSVLEKKSLVHVLTSLVHPKSQSGPVALTGCYFE